LGTGSKDWSPLVQRIWGYTPELGINTILFHYISKHGFKFQCQLQVDCCAQKDKKRFEVFGVYAPNVGAMG
jgi:hypothetical protein